MSFLGVWTEETASIIDFLAPFVDLRSSEKKEKPEAAKSTWLNWKLCLDIFSFLFAWKQEFRQFSLNMNYLKDSTIGRTDIAEFFQNKKWIFTRGNNEPVQWDFSLECTSLSIFRFSALVCWLKSLHANLYMQNTVHDSLSYARSCVSKGIGRGRQQKTH